MHYLRICYDKPGMQDLRLRHVEGHRAWFREHGLPLTILVSGPIRDDATEAEIGSFMLIEADTIDPVRALHDGDPFTAEGIFAESRIDRLDKKIG